MLENARAQRFPKHYKYLRRKKIKDFQQELILIVLGLWNFIADKILAF
ncbi:hypothetical protein EMIT036CA2_10360 [Chryseobacterium sp. IT-36CA2]